MTVLSGLGAAAVGFAGGWGLGRGIGHIPVGSGRTFDNVVQDWMVDHLFPKPQDSGPPRKPPCNPRTTRGFPGEDPEDHHRLPKEFKEWFGAAPRNLNVNDFVTKMPMQWHRGQGISIHSQGYNAAWRQFIKQFPNASREKVLQFLGELEKSLGFGL